MAIVKGSPVASGSGLNRPSDSHHLYRRSSASPGLKFLSNSFTPAAARTRKVDRVYLRCTIRDKAGTSRLLVASLPVTPSPVPPKKKPPTDLAPVCRLALTRRGKVVRVPTDPLLSVRYVANVDERPTPAPTDIIRAPEVMPNDT